MSRFPSGFYKNLSGFFSKKIKPAISNLLILKASVRFVRFVRFFQGI